MGRVVMKTSDWFLASLIAITSFNVVTFGDGSTILWVTSLLLWLGIVAFLVASWSR
jgi:hypothetical protein